MALVESVPNVSEGRRLDVIDRLATALESVPDAHLLDRTSDPSHNRSVFTLAGEVTAVSDALERLVAAALRDINMEEQSGEHPRIPWATRRWTTASGSPASSGGGSRRASASPSTSTRPRRPDPTG
jgi:glutamate formiminotransferase